MPVRRHRAAIGSGPQRRRTPSCAKCTRGLSTDRFHASAPCPLESLSGESAWPGRRESASDHRDRRPHQALCLPEHPGTRLLSLGQRAASSLSPGPLHESTCAQPESGATQRRVRVRTRRDRGRPGLSRVRISPPGCIRLYYPAVGSSRSLRIQRLRRCLHTRPVGIGRLRRGVLRRLLKLPVGTCWSRLLVGKQGKLL